MSAAILSSGINHKLGANNIYIVDFVGQISFEAIIDFIAELKAVEGLPDDLLVLYDLSHASIKVNQAQIKEISEKGIDATDKYTSIRAAFVVAEPKITAYSMLFSQINSSKKTTREIFSTFLAAKDWLLGNR